MSRFVDRPLRGNWPPREMGRSSLLGMSLTGVPLVHPPDLLQDARGADTANEARMPAPEPRRRFPGWRKRLLAFLTGIIALAVLTTGILSDLQVRSELRLARSSLRATQARLRTTQARLRTTQSRLASTLRSLTSVQADLASTTTERDTLEVAFKITAWELSGAESYLASTQTSLANANTGLVLQGTAITTLNTCLAGVEKALNQLSVGDQSGAVTSISKVASSCQVLQGQGKGGPVFPFDFPDPDVIRVGTTYYGYATNSATGNVQMIQSTDLMQWTVLGDALSHLPAWAGHGSTWAPGVFELNGTFVLYYTAFDTLTSTQCVSVAVAHSPLGPFVDSSTSPLVCQPDLGGSIDPNPFIDAGGTPYVTWKSEGANGQPPTIWAQQLSADGTALVGRGPTALLKPSQRWEGGVVEGPSILVWSGHYYLFYSANNWRTANYTIGVAACRGPTGPCSKPFDRPIIGSQATMSGPGGPSLFTDPQGVLWIAFHAWLPSAVDYPHSRLLFLRQVTFTDDLPVVQSAA